MDRVTLGGSGSAAPAWPEDQVCFAVLRLAGRRVWGALLVAVVILAALPAVAGAFTVGGFSLHPEGPGSTVPNTQAGTDADLVLDPIAFGGYASSTDTLKDLSLQLARGLVANPSTIPAADLCPDATLFSPAPSCPPGGRVGSGTLTANVGALMGVKLSAVLYLTAPPSPADAAGVGIIFSLGGTPIVGVAGAADLNPDGTLQFNFANLPQSVSVAGVRQSLQITSLQLTVNGTVNPSGAQPVPFTRLPTSCGAATSIVRADAYSAPGAVQTQATQFAPTGCAKLTYSPKFFRATAILSPRDPGLALTTTFDLGAGAGESATSALSLSLPFSALAPNAGTLIDDACRLPLTAACQPVGTASVSTPLLGDVPFKGSLFAVWTRGLPGLSIVFPKPVGLELDGVTTVGSSGALVETFTNIPDLPLSSLNVTIADTGQDSLFAAGPSLCARSAPALSARFTPRNGARVVTSSVRVTRVNCSGPVRRRPVPPALSLPRSQVVRLANNRTGRVVARCSRGTCAGTLILTVSVNRRTGHGRKARIIRVRRVVASGRFALRAGSRRPTIRVELTAYGRSVLKHHHLRFNASAAMLYSRHVLRGSVTVTGHAAPKVRLAA